MTGVLTLGEAAWQAHVEQLARARGWLVYHAPDNRPVLGRGGKRYVQAVEPGFPDLVLVRGDRVLFRELKTETGRVRPEQKKWLAALEAAGCDVAVWRPSDLSEVNATLRDMGRAA